MIRKILASLIIVGSFAVIGFGALDLSLQPAYAAETDVFKNVCDDPNAQTSTVCKSSDKTAGANPIFGQEGVMTKIINILSIVVGLIAVFSIILAGLKFITSGSNPQDVTKAREMIIYAIVGLIIALTAQAIVQLVLKRLQ